MRAVVITRHGGFDALQVQERPDPVPGPGEVRIAVEAAGVNFSDLLARLGFYGAAPDPPCVVGYEVAGRVAQVGDGVESVRPGDRVMAGTRFGGQSEQVVVRAQDTIPLADSLSFEQGAAVPVNYATAWAGLVRYGGLQAGERVLIHIAAGGVGIAATQIARDRGAEIWGTTSAAKLDAIAGLGVQHPLDYTRSGWERGLPKMDLVMDAVGGRSFRTSYDLLRPGGRLVAYGASSVLGGEGRHLVRAVRTVLTMPRFSVRRQISDSKAVIGLNVLTLWDEFHTLEPWTAPIAELIERGAVRPVVFAAVPFDRAAEAHRILTERRNVGKVVLVP